MRSMRDKAKNQARRPIHIARSRNRHLINAERSCGEIFAEKLNKHYRGIPSPPKKIERGRHKSKAEKI